MYFNIPEISVRQLKALIDAGQRPFLLDIREPHERAIADLEGGTLIPMYELPQRIDELEPYRDESIVVYCRSGSRSAQVVQFLQAMGFENARNLMGGVLAWSREIDPSMPTY